MGLCGLLVCALGNGLWGWVLMRGLEVEGGLV